MTQTDQKDKVPSRERFVVSALLTWSVWSLMYALNGAYVSPPLLPFVFVAALLTVILWVTPPRLRASQALKLSVVLISFSWFLYFIPGPHWPRSLAFGVVMGALVFVTTRGQWRWIGLGVGLAFALLAAAVAWHWGRDGIDVFTITQGGALSFLHGQNPYQAWYSSTTIGVHRFHYDYGPLWILLNVPFAWLGDVRILTALSAFGILGLAAWRFGWRNDSLLWLALLAFSPWLVWPVLQSWTELCAMALTLAWYATYQKWRWSWLLLALALGSNPAVLVIVVPIFVLIPSTRRQVVFGGVAALSCWGGAYLVSGHDMLQAFSIAGSQGYNPSLGITGLYFVFSAHATSKVITAVAFIAALVLAWRAHPSGVSRQEITSGLVALVGVLFLPATYFEYIMIVALWFWWVVFGIAARVDEGVSGGADCR